MSHTTETTVNITSERILRQVAPRVNGEVLAGSRHELFAGIETGVGVKFPRWRYPAVFDCEAAKVKCDIYGGAWGDMKDVENLQQAYSQEVCQEEAVTSGHMLESTEQLEDGTIRMVLLCE